MKKTIGIILTLFLICSMLISGASALNVVTTMPNIWDVTQEIGGDKVTVIYVAPPTAVHISSDTIDAVLQKNSDFINTADLFIGQGGGMDGTPITKVTEFRKTNFGKDTDWKLMNEVPTSALPNATNVYDNPTSLIGYAQTIAYILETADPANAGTYAANLETYLKKISTVTTLTPAEKEALSDVPIICQFRIKNQAETWLGMHVITSYPSPETVQAIVDDIHADPAKYSKIAEDAKCGKIFVVENIVAGQDIGKPIHEALTDEKIPCERVVFLNLPKSADGINSILDYYTYNKDLILDSINDETQTQSPLAVVPIIGALACAVLFLTRRN
ncbi:periplasmic solute binding protein [Methanocorpusculum labreanum Z]|uniref:Periplasmic solute binding protein n=1 Tax=Methanocorpusculum labreanum (strain ATCC 43576 / DSM 4855 / Z) TaxID=410358 RepID=A2SSF8_METLZ|nr:zinc ABC transporter substrate-binding protein [Methanocorpusculum labreanum]ABN07264.1 periplasmic solute binding protein [Methanocorpusculum labreanum Z]